MTAREIERSARSLERWTSESISAKGDPRVQAHARVVTCLDETVAEPSAARLQVVERLRAR